MSNQVPLQVRSRSGLTRIEVMGAAVLLIGMSAMPVAAAGSPQCASRPEILKQLSKRFSEQPVALGLTNTGSLIELLASDDGSTWTIMISQPNGSSCLVAAGESWQQVKRIAAKGERGV